MTDLSRVSLTPAEIIDFLKQDLKLREVYEKVLSNRVVAQAAQDRGITVSPEEIQQDADQLRRENRLEKATDTMRWLAEQLMTVEDWEAGICNRLLTHKLSRSLFATEAECFFIENRLDYEKILLYQMTITDAPLAQEIVYQIEEKEISFYEAAHSYDVDQKRRLSCGYVGKIHRWDLEPEIAAAVFANPVGKVIGPLQSESGYDLFMVEEFLAAEFDKKASDEIVDTLFQEWLESELNYMVYNN